MKQRVLVVVPHNSGTTYLTALLGKLLNAEIPYFHAADGYDGSDHVLSVNKLKLASGSDKSFVCPLHVRNSPSLQAQCKEYRIKKILMTRNIYDTMQSLKDRIRRYKHKTNDSSAIVFAKTLPSHASISEEELELFILRYAVPWYFSFVASWSNILKDPTEYIRYEDLVEDPETTLFKASKILNIETSTDKIESAINAASKMDTRRNKAITGRGEMLEVSYRKEIAEIASLYQGVDFSCILNRTQGIK